MANVSLALAAACRRAATDGPAPRISRLLAGSTLLSGLGMLASALASSWTVLVLARLVVAIGGGLLDGAMNIYFAANFGPRLMNWLHAAFGVGATLAPLAMTAMFVFASIPLLDARSLARRPAYAAHAARVNALVPGFPRPADPPLADRRFFNGPRYARDPWSPRATQGLSADDDVLLIGTGLTAVDVIAQLESAGHLGVIHAVSRHGLLPRVHTAKATVAISAVVSPGMGARESLRALRSDRRRENEVRGALRAPASDPALLGCAHARAEGSRPAPLPRRWSTARKTALGRPSGT